MAAGSTIGADGGGEGEADARVVAMVESSRTERGRIWT